MFFANQNPNTRNIFNDFGLNDKVYARVEGVFFVDKREKLELYLMLYDFDYDGVIFDYSNSKTKYNKESILKRYSGEHWNELKYYMKKSKLKPSKRPDLLRILDHLEQLTVAGN